MKRYLVAKDGTQWPVGSVIADADLAKGEADALTKRGLIKPFGLPAKDDTADASTADAAPATPAAPSAEARRP